MLVGEPYWTEPPPPEALAAFRFGPDEFTSLVGTAQRRESAGMGVVEMVPADGDSWDRYVAGQWWTVDRWLAAHPDHPRRRGDAPVPGRLAASISRTAAATWAGACSSCARAGTAPPGGDGQAGRRCHCWLVADPHVDCTSCAPSDVAAPCTSRHLPLCRAMSWT
jgi:hypothetical protein